MKLKETEHQIQSAILDYLKLKRVFHWRNNTGKMFSNYKGKTRMISFGTVGSPDIFALKGGVLYGLEVKSATGKPTEEQIGFGELMKDNGAIYKVVRSVKEVTEIL